MIEFVGATEEVLQKGLVHGGISEFLIFRIPEIGVRLHKKLVIGRAEQSNLNQLVGVIFNHALSQLTRVTVLHGTLHDKGEELLISSVGIIDEPHEQASG